LFSLHITELANIGDAIAGTDAARAVGESSIDLARTLLASAYDPDYARNMMAEMLLPRVRGYIRQHLCDPDLSADTIALAHGISTRKLFRLCEDADFSLEQWIITNRLQGSHDDLARPESHALSIAAVARRWGFANPSHFARRFRTMYGLSPRAWRNLAAAQTPTPPHA
jgi:AraC-like DNA-binding protein